MVVRSLVLQYVLAVLLGLHSCFACVEKAFAKEGSEEYETELPAPVRKPDLGERSRQSGLVQLVAVQREKIFWENLCQAITLNFEPTGGPVKEPSVCAEFPQLTPVGSFNEFGVGGLQVNSSLAPALGHREPLLSEQNPVCRRTHSVA